ncbi:MAG: TatD family nuclease-associated radical SAM protein [Clostridia bacterium]|nr:TatD family nuclease-associated radical SAM protein [Clostridia bacterium]
MVIAYEVGNGLYVNITNRCTNSCSFCVRSVADGTYGELWLEREPTVDEIVDSVVRADPTRYSEMVFCGYGEPTVRFYDVIEASIRIKQSYPDVKIRINTNGHANLIYGKDVTPLMRGVIDTVSISLNTANARDYVKVCAPEFGLEAYEGLLDFASKAKEHVPAVLFSVVRESIPDEDIEICRGIAERCGVVLKVRDMIK